ncbi:uncharacterized protein EV420DRAFT_236829 [Desarmillaria tabescens]|uniref:Uncharacterized protein n=1 Tax=Armillaria tabescens TaxID=1929756 RepID=A0AA39J5H0_ARMTA|nr:uncharacterized protein EV420DRAFT_236829 [Desarmillaria tabescens]KAK0436491.1 hypothetical protein EV420DRAFT_236829 [Desarmillaria tabescens]
MSTRRLLPRHSTTRSLLQEASSRHSISHISPPSPESNSSGPPTPASYAAVYDQAEYRYESPPPVLAPIQGGRRDSLGVAERHYIHQPQPYYQQDCESRSRGVERRLERRFGPTNIESGGVSYMTFSPLSLSCCCCSLYMYQHPHHRHAQLSYYPLVVYLLLTGPCLYSCVIVQCGMWYISNGSNNRFAYSSASVLKPVIV